MAAGTDAEVHGLGQRPVARAHQYAVPQPFIGPLPLLFRSAAPVVDVVQKTAGAPLRPVLDRAVGEKTASVAREIPEACCRACSTGAGGKDEEKDKDQAEERQAVPVRR
jgi:hypothetical protein